jgi:hypothetical protein
MRTTEERTWHEKVYALSYTMFDSIPQRAPDQWTHWCTVIATTVYCAIAGAIFLTLNIVILPFGIFAAPPWRPKARFRLIRLPKGVPILPFSIAVGLAYATYCTWMLRGPLFALGPWLFVGGLGLVLLGVATTCNRLRGVKRHSFPSRR